MDLYLMTESEPIPSPEEKESLGPNTRTDIEYALDIIRRTLSLLRDGPMDIGMTELTIFRLESVEDRLHARLGDQEEEEV